MDVSTAGSFEAERGDVSLETTLKAINKKEFVRKIAKLRRNM